MVIIFYCELNSVCYIGLKYCIMVPSMYEPGEGAVVVIVLQLPSLDLINETYSVPRQLGAITITS